MFSYLDEALEYYSWTENEPNTDNQWVMMAEVNGMYLWSTANSSYSAHYFCERNPGLTSEAMVTTVTNGNPTGIYFLIGILHFYINMLN